MTAHELLTSGLEQLGQHDPQAVDKLLAFSDLLLEKNKVMNLPAVTDPLEVVTPPLPRLRTPRVLCSRKNRH